MKRVDFALIFILIFTIVARAAYITQYHTVKKGETLSSVAAKYNVSVEEIKNWNNIKSNKIVVGQNLIVKKYPGNEASAYYTVKKGDTLSGISTKTGVSMKRLQEYNNLSASSVLYPGQKIRIVSETQKTMAEQKSQTSLAKSDIYIVKKGDTLSGISRKTGISINELKTINNLNGSKLAIGQRLVLRINNDTLIAAETRQMSDQPQQVAEAPEAARQIYINRYHTIKKGDNLNRIANKYGTTVARIKQLNNLKSSKIYPGQTIIVARIVKDVPQPFVEPTPIAPVTPKVYYTVKFGDTLDSIAAKFGISVSSLTESNLLSDGRVRMGQTLVIPEVAKNSDGINSETSISTQSHIYNPSQVFALKIIENAMSFINTPYRYGGMSKKGIDCSGLVKKSFEDAGIVIPRTSREQAQKGEMVPISAIKPGDLLFFGVKGRINHVGIYIGDNKFIHASKGDGKVVVANLDDSYYQQHLICARSFFANDILGLEDRGN
ncbi:MAG TPA: LysM peptidoglycan-binding domain-containing protein [bacterium]|nr:LysM peptidoglycan-binding domain-containing protein [bacterium]